MIQLSDVTKTYRMRGTDTPILKGVNLTINPGERVGVLGRNGAGKSTLIRLISGVEQPTSGLIDRKMSISWPLAFGGTFLGALTGYDNFRFICRLYNVDPVTKVDFVEDFCELGRYFHEPLKTYSSGMRARLAFAVSMAVEFDCFMIDEIVAVGDFRFQQKCDDELFRKRADRAFLIVSHNADFIRDHCTSAKVLADGVLEHFSTIDAAYHAYSSHLAASVKSQAMSALDPNLVSDAHVPTQPASELDRREAIMEEQIAVLTNFMISSEKKALDDDTVAAFIQALTNDFLELQTFLGVVDQLKCQGNIDASARFARVVAQAYGQNSLYHVVVGDLYTIQGNDKSAIDAYAVAISVDPTSYWGFRNLGIALFKIGDYAGAIPHFEKALLLGNDLSQKREIVRHIIDCHTYLELTIPKYLIDKVSPPGNELSEISCKFYEHYGILSIQVQGFIRNADARGEFGCVLNLGDINYSPITFGYGSNSYRRYAQFTESQSFTAVFLIELSEKPVSATVKLHGGGSILSESEITAITPDFRATFPGYDLLQPASERAGAAFKSHEYEIAVVLSGFALNQGQAIESEYFVEALIALGRFSEAEAHLEELFSLPLDPALLEENGARLFELYCSEIARSRLIGWEGRISLLVNERLALAPDEASGLTNQGHLLVHAGKLRDAIACYRKAGEAAKGRDIIHFACGITSARYAKFGRPPIIPETLNPRSNTGLLHLISCDAKYFKRYGPAVVSSSRTAGGAEHVALHVHIVDPDLEALDLARSLSERHEFRVTSEFFPFPAAPQSVRIAYYTSARFIIAKALMAAYDRPVLITATDCLINWSWDEIRQWCEGTDFGSLQSALWSFVPWTKIPAGIIYFDNGPVGQAIADDVRAFLMRVFANENTYQTNLWTIDQVALWLAWEKFGKRVSTRHLPMTSMLRLATGDKTNILIPENG